MPVRLCLEAKCAAPATYRGRCAQHARTNERFTHDKDRKRIYNSKRWAIIRRKVLFDQPLCPCGRIATDVDHVAAIEDGGDPWARANLQGLCHQCHSIKTQQEQANR